MAVASTPVALDPDLADEEQTISALANVYESLVERDAALAPQPGLAASWLSNEGDRRWSFELRPQARFHDGAPADAAAVRASLERSRTWAGSVHRQALEPIERVEVDGPGTVVIWTRYPLASLPDRLTNTRISRPPSRVGEPALGTGPYRIGRSTPGRELQLEAVEPATPIQTLVFQAVPSARERAEELLAGTVDLILHVDPADRARLSARRDVHVRSEQGLRLLFLGMDCSHPGSPFRDARLRRALSLAVDREALVQGPLEGQASPIAQMVTPTVLGYAADVTPPPQDPGEARRLLAEAGLGSGLDLALDYMPEKYRAMPAVAQALAAQLERVGLRVSLRPNGIQELLQRVQTHSSRLYLMGWMTTGWDAAETYSFFFRGPQAAAAGCVSPEVERLLQQAERQFDASLRAAVYQQVTRLTSADAVVVPLYREVDVSAHAAWLRWKPRVDRRVIGARLAPVP